MPLTKTDRRFLHTIDRMKVYLLCTAIAIFVFLLLTPGSEMQMATSIMGLTLCGVFWLTQRLLSFISVLDFELTRIGDAVKSSMSESRRKEFFPD